MQLQHELIDRDNPRCLYCQSDFDIKLDSDGRTYSVEILTCRKCCEVFEIHSEEDPITYSKILAFVFSCNKIYVRHSYEEDVFHIGNFRMQFKFRNKGGAGKYTTIPSFNIDFSDKEKIFNKLKTYLVFS